MNDEVRKIKKAKFLEYFKQLPLQSLGADFIGVNSDTITNWKKEDKEFSDAIASAKADWALDKVGKVRSKEWLLERIMKNDFAPRTELTGAEGKDLPVPLIDVRNNHSNNKDTEAK